MLPSRLTLLMLLIDEGKLVKFLEFRKHLRQESGHIFHTVFLYFPSTVFIWLCSPTELNPFSLCFKIQNLAWLFILPSVLMFPDLSFFFHLISRLEEVYHIIRQWSRAKQYIKPQRSMLFCSENDASSSIMRLKKEDNVPGGIFQELQSVDIFN